VPPPAYRHLYAGGGTQAAPALLEIRDPENLQVQNAPYKIPVIDRGTLTKDINLRNIQEHSGTSQEHSFQAQES
jgi:hypothetical protein